MNLRPRSYHVSISLFTVLVFGVCVIDVPAQAGFQTATVAAGSSPVAVAVNSTTNKIM